MDRRAFLGGLAGLATSAGLAGCSGDPEVPETAPEPPGAVQAATDVPDGATGDRNQSNPNVGGPVAEAESGNSISLLGQDSFAGDDGGLVVTITVGNEGTSRSQALVQVDVKNDDRDVVATLEKYVDLLPGESTTVRFTPDLTYDEYGSHDPRVLAETPATPLPSDTATRTASPTPTPSPMDDGTPTDS